jgi:phenylacetyl-CoA:acceptor oxidoreductase subunit 2
MSLLFLYCQAMILKEAKGIPAWRAPFVVPLIMMTGLAEGAGLFLLAVTLSPELKPIADAAAVAVVFLVAARSWAWRAYLASLRSAGAPTRTLDVLTAYRPWFFVLGLMTVVALIAVGFVATSAATPLFALAGICAFAAGWALKFILVTRAAYNQGFALKHTPVRGSGAAGLPVKPGWSTP